MEFYVQPWKKFAVFSGRARRKEYWTFSLINCAIIIVLICVDAVAGTIDSKTFFGLFSVGFILVSVIPSLAVLVRRLHDINRSGWWVLLSFIPLGGLVILVFTLLDSDPGTNEYGPNPKMPDAGFAPYSSTAQQYSVPSGQAFAQAAGADMPQPPIAQPSHLFCNACGKPLIPGSSFCGSCGRAV